MLTLFIFRFVVQMDRHTFKIPRHKHKRFSNFGPLIIVRVRVNLQNVIIFSFGIVRFLFKYPSRLRRRRLLA